MKVLNFSLINLRRSPYRAMSAILVLALTFFLLARFSLLAINTQTILSFFESRPHLSIYFKTDVSYDKIGEFKKEIENNNKVTDITFVSKEDALKIYKEQNKNDQVLLDLVTPDILPASLEVRTADSQTLSKIAQDFKGKSEVDQVVFQEDIIKQLKQWVGAVRLEGLIVIGSLIVVSLTVILLIVGLRISSRREEIQIMQLIGATKWFIRRPFILEGVIYGGVGAFLGTSVGFLVFFFLSPYFSSSLFNPSFNLPVNPFNPLVLAVTFASQIIFGIVLGLLGSFLALWRYLR